CISRFLPYLKRYFRFLSVGSVGKALNFFRMIFSSSFILSSSLRRSNSSRSVSFRGSLFDTCFWLFSFLDICFIGLPCLPSRAAGPPSWILRFQLAIVEKCLIPKYSAVSL